MNWLLELRQIALNSLIKTRFKAGFFVPVKNTTYSIKLKLKSQDREVWLYLQVIKSLVFNNFL
jgi:hypothetical protein